MQISLLLNRLGMAASGDDYRELEGLVCWNEDYVQGAGGNISVKHGQYMLIKASGSRIGSFRNNGSGVTLVRQRISNDHSSFQSDPFNIAKPSMELGLHLATEDPYVLHLHSIGACAFGVVEGLELPDTLLGLIDVISYRSPGAALAQAWSSSATRAPWGALFENHGLLIRGSSVAEISARLRYVEFTLRSYLGRRAEGNPSVVSVKSLDEVNALGSFFPDQVILTEKARTRVGEGVRLDSEIEEYCRYFSRTMSLTRADDSLRPLPGWATGDLLSDPNEKFRIAKAEV
jgi:rhamnose utilization protein RhaD (predicted bifunctional aldolase and dehydrogenase)